jgi:cell division protein ZapA (FtsZ GTPase activity inhibitor)
MNLVMLAVADTVDAAAVALNAKFFEIAAGATSTSADALATIASVLSMLALADVKADADAANAMILVTSAEADDVDAVTDPVSPRFLEMSAGDDVTDAVAFADTAMFFVIDAVAEID